MRGQVVLSVQGVPGRSVTVGPNPFNPVGTIRFDVERVQTVRVRLYDISGRLIRTLLDERNGLPGPRSIRVDGLDSQGRPLASGVYFYAVERGPRVDRGRITLLK